MFSQKQQELWDRIGKTYLQYLTKHHLKEDLETLLYLYMDECAHKAQKITKSTLSSIGVEDLNNRVWALFSLLQSLPSIQKPDVRIRDFRYFVHWVVIARDTYLFRLIVDVYPEYFYADHPMTILTETDKHYTDILEIPSMVDVFVEMFMLSSTKMHEFAMVYGGLNKFKTSLFAKRLMRDYYNRHPEKNFTTPSPTKKTKFGWPTLIKYNKVAPL